MNGRGQTFGWPLCWKQHPASPSQRGAGQQDRVHRLGVDDERWDLPGSDRARLGARSERLSGGREKVEEQVWRNVVKAGSGEPGAWGALRARSIDVDLILELPYGPAAIDKAATEAEHMAAPDHAQQPEPKILLASVGASTLPCGILARSGWPR